VSRRWSFLLILTVFHHHHLPRAQSEPEVVFFTRLHLPNTTSFASKSEPEVVFSARHASTTCPQGPSTTNTTSDSRLRVPRMQKGGGVVAPPEVPHHCLPLASHQHIANTPPPSHAKASWRWSFLHVTLRQRVASTTNTTSESLARKREVVLVMLGGPCHRHECRECLIRH